MASTENAPQEFTYGNKNLSGRLISFNSDSKRRSVSHVYLKRDAGLVEDMANEQQKLVVQILFTSDLGNPVTAYRAFRDYVNSTPRALLVHPIAGKWFAFCEGPSEQIDFSHSTDEIKITVGFVETISSELIPVDVPNVATAAQNASAQVATTEASVAKFFGDLGKGASAFSVSTAHAISAIDEQLSVIDTITEPMQTMTATLDSVVAARSGILGKINTIKTSALLLSQSVTNFVDAATDVFDGAEVLAGVALSVSTLLNTVMQNTVRLQTDLIAGQATPAGSADAYGAADEQLASCMLLDDAVRAARPTAIYFTMPELTELVTFCQRRYKKNAQARAADIMSLNRIPNPAAIKAGTVLLIPSS